MLNATYMSRSVWNIPDEIAMTAIRSQGCKLYGHGGVKRPRAEDCQITTEDAQKLMSVFGDSRWVKTSELRLNYNLSTKEFRRLCTKIKATHVLKLYKGWLPSSYYKKIVDELGQVDALHYTLINDTKVTVVTLNANERNCIGKMCLHVDSRYTTQYERKLIRSIFEKLKLDTSLLWE